MSNQTVYNKRYQAKDKDRTNYLKDRSKARSFIRNKATREDLEELKELIQERESNIR